MVRAAWSRTTEAMFEALGATTSDEPLDPTTMIGAESSFRLTPAGTATGNVVFFPKVNVLSFIRRRRVNGLTSRAAHGPARGRRRYGRLGPRDPADRRRERADLLRRGRSHLRGDSGADRQPGRRHPRRRRRPPRRPDDRPPSSTRSPSMAAHDPAPERVTSCPPSGDGPGSAAQRRLHLHRHRGGHPGRRRHRPRPDRREHRRVHCHPRATARSKPTQIYSQGPKPAPPGTGPGATPSTASRSRSSTVTTRCHWTTALGEDPQGRHPGLHEGRDGAGPEEQALSEAWYTSWPRQDG